MSLDLSMLAPPTRLAIAHANKRLRSGFALLLVFDDRLADIVGKSSEPIFAQMKLAWWRDVLGKPVEARPRGEPLVLELARLEDSGRFAGVTGAMRSLLDGWELLAANEHWEGEVLQEFARARSMAIFGTYANWTGSDGAGALGEAWAVDDLADRFGEKVSRPVPAKLPSLPRTLRPLSILAFAAHAPRRCGSGPRLVWHALTGR